MAGTTTALEAAGSEAVLFGASAVRIEAANGRPSH
jgi:hypothetical protein